MYSARNGTSSSPLLQSFRNWSKEIYSVTNALSTDQILAPTTVKTIPHKLGLGDGTIARYRTESSVRGRSRCGMLDSETGNLLIQAVSPIVHRMLSITPLPHCRILDCDPSQLLVLPGSQ